VDHGVSGAPVFDCVGHAERGLRADPGAERFFRGAVICPLLEEQAGDFVNTNAGAF